MSASLAAGLGVLLVGSLLFHAAGADAATLLTPSRSTTIALTEDNRLLVVVNRETHSLSVFRVRNLLGQELDPPVKLAEVAVGVEPRCVALHPSGSEAYVTNGVSGTVSVVDLSGLNRFRVVAEIPVGTEPRGCAITPNGGGLFVANHTEGTVGLIDIASRTYLGALFVGGNPMAIAISNNGDTNDLDETVFVTQLFSELIPGGLGEARDTGKQGIVNAIPLTTFTPTRITG